MFPLSFIVSPALVQPVHLVPSESGREAAPALVVKLSMLALEHGELDVRVTVSEVGNARPLVWRVEDALCSVTDAMLRAAENAHAEQIEVVVCWEPGALSLRVRHDGQPHLVETIGKAGPDAGDLRWIADRLRELGGSFASSARAGGGAELVAKLWTE